MSVNIARTIIRESEFAGETPAEKAASRQRWRRMIERNKQAPVIKSGNEDALLHIAKAFVILDESPEVRVHLNKSIEILFYTLI